MTARPVMQGIGPGVTHVIGVGYFDQFPNWLKVKSNHVLVFEFRLIHAVGAFLPDRPKQPLLESAVFFDLCSQLMRIEINPGVPENSVTKNLILYLPIQCGYWRVLIGSKPH